MNKILVSCCAAVLLATLAFGCSSSRKGSYWGDGLTDELASYEEIPQVDYAIAGTVTCQKCIDNDIEIIGLMIEVALKDEPLDIIKVQIKDDLSPFYIPDMRGRPGDTLILHCSILGGENGEYLYSAKAEVQIPDQDGGVADATVNF